MWYDLTSYEPDTKVQENRTMCSKKEYLNTIAPPYFNHDFNA